MKSIKNHISFIIPLFILLFSIQFSFMLDRGVNAYEDKLAGDYSIVVVASNPLDEGEIKQKIPQISAMIEIKKDRYIDKLKDDMSKADLVYLKATLPYFYSLKLSKLPNKEELQLISSKIKKFPKIQKVEVFKKTFNKFHQFLKLSKSASYVFTIFIFIISFLLIIKQMEIWSLQHKQRMYIMGLFGAPYWMKSASLYKSVVIDALISAMLVGLVFTFLPSFVDLAKLKADLGIDLQNFSFASDTILLVAISLLISLISVTTIILRQKDS
ncbi:MAG TPA: ABC transporter permease [Campylobacterales bacterium]|nr:ABC transporter permease [Campylobacterales bacterium]